MLATGFTTTPCVAFAASNAIITHAAIPYHSLFLDTDRRSLTAPPFVILYSCEPKRVCHYCRNWNAASEPARPRSERPYPHRVDRHRRTLHVSRPTAQDSACQRNSRHLGRVRAAAHRGRGENG